MRLPGVCGPSYQSQTISADAQLTENCYLERNESGNGKSEWQLISRPGKNLALALAGGVIRGQLFESGRWFVVCGIKVFEVFSDLSSQELGNIKDDGSAVSMAFGQPANGTGWLIIASGGTVYTVNLSAVFPGNAPTIVGAFAGINIGIVLYSEGYFIAVESSSNRWFVSNPFDASTWDLGNFARISVFSGNIISAIASRGQVLFGLEKTGVGYYLTNSVFPFDVDPSGKIEQGSAAKFGATEVDNTTFFWGRDAHGQAIGYRLNGITPQRCTNHAIENEVQGFPRIDDAESYAWQHKGHTFWVTRFPSANGGKGRTLAYAVETGQWYHWSYQEADGTVSADLGRNHVLAFDKHYVGDWKSGNIYEVSDQFLTDNGQPIRGVRRFPYIDSDAERVFFSRLRLILDVGVGPNPPLKDGQGNARGPQMMLRYSRDGARTWSAEMVRDCGQLGKYLTRVMWTRMGSADGKIGMVFELSFSDPIAWKIVDADIDVSPAPRTKLSRSLAA